ncbi:TonB-dependent receptor [Shewanella oncorhynchi]|uniref:TonB-dependent receptor n=1 Tax=Shewanella oncorhynchi TaxID=2726434 RepID=UPI003D79C674
MYQGHIAHIPYPLTVLALFLASAGIQAQASTPKETDEMEIIVVSATRTAQDIKSSPSAINVITEEDIQGMTLFTIDEALGKTAGVMDRRTKGFMETTPSLTIRGLSNARDTLVLVDGVPQNDSRNGQVNWTMIDSENVQQIEVVRGPFSSLYGGNAIGGVVNIFTKVPDENSFSMKLGIGGSADSIAPENFHDQALQGTLKILDSVALGANYRKRETDGYPTTHVNASDAVIDKLPEGVTGWLPYTTNIGGKSNLIGDMGDNWFNDETYGLRLTYTPSDDTRLNLSYANSDSVYGYDQPHSLLRTTEVTESGKVDSIPTYGNIPMTTWLNGALFARGGSTTQTNTGLNLSTSWDQINLHISAGHISKETTTIIAGLTTASAGHAPMNPVTFEGGDGRLAPATESTRKSIDVQLDMPLGDNHTLVLGVATNEGDVTEERWSLSNWTDPKSKVFMSADTTAKDQIRSFYIQDAWQLNNEFTVYIGARQDWWKMRGGESHSYTQAGGTGSITYDKVTDSPISPKISMVYKPSTDTSYRASLGKAFRAPNLYEFFGTASLGGNIYVGNPDLKPETLVSWELGVDHSFQNNINAIATIYRSEINDRIATQTVDGISMPQNVAEAEIQGIELELKGTWHYGLGWSANYTYTDSEVTQDPNLNVVGKALPHTPKNMYNLNLNWRQGSWYITANHSYQSKRFTNVTNTDVVTHVPGSTDSFMLTDVKTTYFVSDNITASLGINNLFNEQYKQFYLSPGRFWFAELRLSY